MNNDKTIALLRGLIRMRMADPSAYELLVKMLQEKQSELIEQACVVDDTVRIYRLQGGIKAMHEALKKIGNPNELLHSIEQNLG